MTEARLIISSITKFSSHQLAERTKSNEGPNSITMAIARERRLAGGVRSGHCVDTPYQWPPYQPASGAGATAGEREQARLPSEAGPTDQPSIHRVITKIYMPGIVLN